MQPTYTVSFWSGRHSFRHFKESTEQSIWYIGCGVNVGFLLGFVSLLLYFNGVLLQGDRDPIFMMHPPLPNTLLFTWIYTELFFFHFGLQLFIFIFKIIEQKRQVVLSFRTLSGNAVGVLTKEITTSCFCFPIATITAMVLRYFYCGFGVKIKCAG